MGIFSDKNRSYLYNYFDKNILKNLIARAEMEQRADGVDASVLVFFLGCANSLAVYGKAN